MGRSSSTRAQWLVACVLAVAALLCVYGLWTEFVPSALGARCGLWLSLAVALPLSFFAWRGYLGESFPRGQGLRRQIGWLSYLAAIPLVTFGILWVVSVRAVPDIAARIIGTQTSVNMELRASHAYRKYSCDYQLHGDPLSFPGYICVSSSQFSQFPEQGEMTLSGPATSFGMHVSRVEAAPSQRLRAM